MLTTCAVPKPGTSTSARYPFATTCGSLTQLLVVLDPLADDLRLRHRGTPSHSAVVFAANASRILARISSTPSMQPRAPMRLATVFHRRVGTTSGRSTKIQKSSHDSSLIATTNRIAPPSLVS